MIEVVSRLLHQTSTSPKKLSLVTAAEIMQPFYETGSELSQWTDEDPAILILKHLY